MAALVDIFNQALLLMGGKPILLPTEQSPGAKACDRAWPIIRQEVLSEHAWQAVVARIQLPKSQAAPVHGYAFQYPLPADNLRILSVNEFWPDDRRWVVESTGIVTDIDAPLDVVYIRDEEDTTRYSALLVSALSHRLALEIIERRTQSNTKREQLQNLYSAILRKAKATDVREQSSAQYFDAESISVRFG